jgi:hypothetical protein
MKINELLTVSMNEVSDEIKNKILTLPANTPTENEYIYKTILDNQFILVAKTEEKLLGYLVAEKISLNNYEYIAPLNLFSFMKDSGKTALDLVKTLLKEAKQAGLHVVTDLRMTEASKKFFRKQIELGNISGEILNIDNGEITNYNPDIWEKDDNYRVLLLEHFGIRYRGNGLLMDYWRQL